MKFVNRFLPAISSNDSVESRLFEVTLIISNIILYFWTVYGFIYGYHWPTQLVYISATVIYTLFYLAYLKWSVTRALVLSYYTVALLLLGLAWLPSGGVLGAINHMFVLVFISGLLVLNLSDFKKMILVALVIFLGFSIIEIQNPDAAAVYVDRQTWILDVAVAQIVMLIVLAVTLFFYKKEYTKDRNALQIANDGLEKAMKKAEQSDQAKDNFLSNVSHEIRTPLNGILGNLEILQNTALTEEQQQIVKDLNHSSDMLHGLISDLLDVSMINDGGILLQENEIDLQQLITNVVQFFIPKLALKEGNVSVHYRHDWQIPKYVTGDLTRTRQVLINLVNNAVKFTNHGSVEVSTELVSKQHSEAVVKFRIKDSGIGVPDEFHKTIFDTFQRSPNISKEGIGLGLSVCRKVVEAMGGQIGLVESSQSGSEFYFQIPFKCKNEPVASKTKCVPEVANQYSRLSVLVAEDQKINQLVIRKMLNNLGITKITVVEDGEHAVERALLGSFDFILMDLMMPKKDGIQATLEILDLNRTHPPVIMALTANATQVEMEHCLNAGMKDFITKPLSLEILQSSIDKFVV